MSMIRSTRVPLLATLVLVASCSTPSTPKALPPQTMAPIPPETEEPISNSDEYREPLPEVSVEPPPAAPAPNFEIVEEPATTAVGNAAPVSAEGDNELTVVLDPGTNEESQPRSLFEASKAEKGRREEVGESDIVLTNETLKEYSKGQLTFAEEEPGDGDDPSGDASASDDTENPDEALDEEYWRNRVLDIRVLWRESLDRMDELESDIARLRREFYAEDDPFYRDSQIKPAWDQALIELEETRRDAEISQGDLDDAMDEGRRAGAMPGWLREGIELEPTMEELEERQPPSNSQVHEPSEPVIVDDDGDGGGASRE